MVNRQHLLGSVIKPSFMFRSFPTLSRLNKEIVKFNKRLGDNQNSPSVKLSIDRLVYMSIRENRSLTAY